MSFRSVFLGVLACVLLSSVTASRAESLQTINKSSLEIKIDANLRKNSELASVDDALSQTVAPGATDTIQTGSSKYVHGVTVYSRADSSSNWKKIYQWVSTLNLVSKQGRKYVLEVDNTSKVILKMQNDGQLYTLSGNADPR